MDELSRLPKAANMEKAWSCGENSWKRTSQKAGTRAAGLLVRILTVEFDMSDFLNSLEKWDNLVKQHDAMVDALEGVQDRVKIATLISRMRKGVVEDHFLVEVAKYTRYDQLGKDLVDLLSAKKHLGGDSSGSGRDHGGPTHMEIGMVKGSQYGKGQHQQNK